MTSSNSVKDSKMHDVLVLSLPSELHMVASSSKIREALYSRGSKVGQNASLPGE